MTKGTIHGKDPEIKYLYDIAARIYKTCDTKGLKVDELVSEGWIALQEKKAAFDPSRGIKLEAYAYRRVYGAMRDAINRQKPRGYRKHIKPGQKDPIHEIEYDDALNSSEPEALKLMEVREANAVMIKVLKKRERTILVERAAGEKLKPLARRYKVSRSRVRQIQVAAREKVRKVIVRGKT